MTNRIAPAGGSPAPAIRLALPGDEPAILGLIRALAEFEREPDAVVTTEQDLADTLFPADREPLAHCLVAEADGSVVGMAIWFVTYSTWEGRHGIHVEDLFVQPSHRRLGLGRLLLAALAAEVERRGYRRLEWQVLEWNDPARGFYESLLAEPLTEWIPYRLSGAPLAELGRTHAPSP